MSVFERPLNVGKEDNFTLTLSPKYLDGETITSSTVTTLNTELTIIDVSNSLDTISVKCTSTAEGVAELHFSWTTPSRSGCASHDVIIISCEGN